MWLPVCHVVTVAVFLKHKRFSDDIIFFTILYIVARTIARFECAETATVVL